MTPPDVQLVVPSASPAVDEVAAAVMARTRDRRPRPPYRLDVTVFRTEPAHVWPAYQEAWLPAITKGLMLADAISGPADIVRIDFRLTTTTAGPPRTHIAVRSLADSYRP